MRLVFGHDDSSFDSAARYALRRSKLCFQPASIPGRSAVVLAVLMTRVYHICFLLAALLGEGHTSQHFKGPITLFVQRRPYEDEPFGRNDLRINPRDRNPTMCLDRSTLENRLSWSIADRREHQFMLFFFCHRASRSRASSPYSLRRANSHPDDQSSPSSTAGSAPPNRQRP